MTDQDFRVQFGISVLAERCRRRWSVDKCAEKGGMSHVTWRRIEKGEGFQNGQHAKIDVAFGLESGTSLRCFVDRLGIPSASPEMDYPVVAEDFYAGYADGVVNAIPKLTLTDLRRIRDAAAIAIAIRTEASS